MNLFIFIFIFICCRVRFFLMSFTSSSFSSYVRLLCYGGQIFIVSLDIWIHFICWYYLFTIPILVAYILDEVPSIISLYYIQPNQAEPNQNNNNNNNNQNENNDNRPNNDHRKKKQKQNLIILYWFLSARSLARITSKTNY